MNRLKLIAVIAITMLGGIFTGLLLAAQGIPEWIAGGIGFTLTGSAILGLMK